MIVYLVICAVGPSWDVAEGVISVHRTEEGALAAARREARENPGITFVPTDSPEAVDKHGTIVFVRAMELEP